MSPQRIGMAIRRARKAKGMTQLGLARKAKVDQGYLSLLEAGKKKNPGITIIQKLAKALQVPVTTLLE
jgi:transcriptional regulator with XRE-family HTH domain